MEWKQKILITVVAAVFAPALAIAAPTLDQNQPIGTTVMAQFSQGGLAQSFQQANNNVTGAGILLDPGYGSSGTVTISLWDALPNQGGISLATGSASGSPGSWVDVYWSPVMVVPDTTLYLVFTSTSSAMAISGTGSNPYSRGHVYANTGYQPFSEFDYTFRTYYEDTLVIPAPSSIGLVVAGLAALRFARRKISV